MTDTPIAAAEAGASGSAAFTLLNKRIDSDEYQRELRARLVMLRTARDYYDGRHPKPLKVRRGDQDPNVIVNFCRKIVNASVAWLFGDNESGEMLKMELEEGEAAEAPEGDGSFDVAETPEVESDAAEYLRAVWRLNGGARLLQRIGRRASIGGHGFVKILPADDPANRLGVPAIVPQKLEMVSVLTEPDDTDAAEAYVIQWTEKRLDRGSRLVEVRVRQIIAKTLEGGRPWVIATFENTGPRRDWVVVEGPTPWPYAWPPIIDWQNLPNDDGYYGLSDLEDLTSINDAINLTVSNFNRILYIHGHPRTVGTGFEAGDVQDTAIDSFWTIANKEAKVQNLEMQSDLGAGFDFLQFLSQSFYNIGRDLDIASLQDKIGQITNFGLRVLANLALSKLGEKRMSYGEAIIKINRALLDLGGFPVQDTKLHWRNPLPEDAKEEVERLRGERDMGIVSKETAAEERGRDWSTEKERIEQERSEDENLGGALLTAFERGGTFRELAPPRRPDRAGTGAPAAQEGG